MSEAFVLAFAAVAASGALLLRAAALRRTRRDRERLADAALLDRLTPVAGRRVRWWRAGLLGAGVALLAAVAAGLGAREVLPEAEPAGLETVLLLDASNSMLATDVSPSRLERQRALALRLADRLPGKVGVVYFAGRGYVLSPLTVDPGAVRMYVEAVAPASVGRGGTALAAGISEALKVLDGGEGGVPGAVVLFSDGEETVGAPLEQVVSRAARSGVAVHAVGIGTPEGGPIPLGPDAAMDARPPAWWDRGGQEVLRGPDGEVVVTRLHAETLEAIAEATGARLLPAEEAAMDRLAGELAARAAPASPARSGSLPARGLLLLAFALLWLEAFVVGGSFLRPGAHLRALSLRSAWKPALVAGVAAATLGPGPAATQAGTGEVPSGMAAQESAGEREPTEVARWRSRAARSDRPLDWYNLGTALLKEERWEDAREPLERTVDAASHRIRSYGRYNHGLAGALWGRHGEGAVEARRRALLSARESFREVLRDDPGDEDARWNLEVVERWLESPPMAGAGGAGEEDGDGGDADGPPEPGGLDHGAAEALLDEAARTEADVRGRALERGRLRDPPVERNW